MSRGRRSRDYRGVVDDLVPVGGSHDYMGGDGHVAAGVTRAMVESPCWRVRLDAHEHYVPRRHRQTMQQYIFWRVEFCGTGFRLQGLDLDLAYARTYLEWRYAPRIAALTEDDFGTEFFDAKLLLATERLVCAGRTSLPSVHSVQQDFLFYPPAEWRAFERVTRNRHNIFVSYQHREVQIIHEEALPWKYPALPGWWGDYEVPFGFRPESPWYLSYCGLSLSGESRSDEDPQWHVVLSEWAQNCAIELLYQARAGRFWWLPGPLVEAMRELGAHALLAEASVEDQGDLAALWDYIDRAKWSLAPVTNRVLPEIIGAFTPVYAAGDWISFDVTQWRPADWDRMSVPVDAAGKFTPDDRGARVTGRADRLPQEGRPGGLRAQEGARIERHDFPSREARRGLSRTQIASAEDMFIDFMIERGGTSLLDALRRNGVRGRVRFTEVIDLLHRLLIDGDAPVPVAPAVVPVVGAGPGTPGVNEADGMAVEPAAAGSGPAEAAVSAPAAEEPPAQGS